MTFGVSNSAMAHPLDPLSSKEIAIVGAELHRAGYADAAMRFLLIELDEPNKQAVLAWRPGQPMARKAFVVARRNRMVYEAVVDLVAPRVERPPHAPRLISPEFRCGAPR